MEALGILITEWGVAIAYVTLSNHTVLINIFLTFSKNNYFGKMKKNTLSNGQDANLSNVVFLHLFTVKKPGDANHAAGVTDLVSIICGKKDLGKI